jgi:2-polyprenyl-6-methoxyphenol hydroxylase-like FAD-dependent oxidoreductase
MSIIIAGGGVGGLTLALMCHARGLKAIVYEQASQVREVGVGINMLPHSVGELAALGLLAPLDAVAIRTHELVYVNRYGQEVWREKRGLDAGHPVPQFSIHRGRLQKLLYDAVIARLGPDSVVTGHRLVGFVQNEGGVTAHFADSREGSGSLTARGEILIGADGIHSVVRRAFFPGEGPPSWQGVMMWRGAIDWPTYLDGRTMFIGGGMGGKIVLYPIGEGATPGTRLTNWVVCARLSDEGSLAPGKDSWSRQGRRDEMLPFARRFAIPGVDFAGLCAATPAFYEYPMCDRDPLPRWSHGRVSLIGDAAHPMYPVGSNGASQAILDARMLADLLERSEHPVQALELYEKDRLPKTADVVRMNRKGGPEGVIDAVEKLAPAGFDDIETILPRTEREAIVRGYAGRAGFAVTKGGKAA